MEPEDEVIITVLDYFGDVEAAATEDGLVIGVKGTDRWINPVPAENGLIFLIGEGEEKGRRVEDLDAALAWLEEGLQK